MLRSRKGGPIETLISARRKPHWKILAAGASVSTVISGAGLVSTQLHPDRSSAAIRYTEANGADDELSLSQERQMMLHAIRKEQKRRQKQAASRSEQRAPLPAHPNIPAGTPRAIGYSLLMNEGGNEVQWHCLNELWDRESNWNPTAYNSASGAYGVPQALPGDKMASEGADWRTNPVPQIRWGLGYIAARYGSPCAALEHSNETGYY